MAFNSKSMTLDYRAIMSIPFGTRESMVKTGILDTLSLALTPGQKVALFPSYYKRNLDVMAGQRSMAGGQPEPKFATSAEFGKKRGLSPSDKKVLNERGIDTSGAPQTPASLGTRKPSYSKESVSPDYFKKSAATYIPRLMKDFGLTKEQAAGIVGNLGHESAGMQAGIQERGVKVGRGGLGWAQWTGPRRKEFESFLEKNGMSANDPEANYAFLKQELQTTEAPSLEKLKQTKSIEEATVVFEESYERAGVKSYGSRVQYAKDGLKAFETAEDPATMAQIKPVPQVGELPSADDFYGSMRSSFGEKISTSDAIWDQLDPELKKNKDKLVDAETGLVGRDTLLAADAAAKVLRKNGYIPRPVSGGDNHSINHGQGRDANYSIDMAAAIEDESGKITNVQLGSGVDYNVKRDMAMASFLASQGSNTNNRIGFPLGDSAASMHIQQDPDIKSANWGYDSRTSRGASASRTILETTPEGKQYLADMESLQGLDKKDKSALLASVTGMTGQTKLAQTTVQAAEIKADTNAATVDQTQPTQTASIMPAKPTMTLPSFYTDTATTAFAGGGEIEQPHMAVPLTSKGDQSNKLIAETGPERITPRHKIKAEEVGQQSYQMPVQQPQMQEKPKEVSKPESPTQPIMTTGVVPRPMSMVAVDHPIMPPTARKAYADAKLEPRYNNLSPIGAVYTNHGV